MSSRAARSTHLVSAFSSFSRRTIAASGCRKTWSSENSPSIADDCFAWLDAPVKRVASTDTYVGYAPQLEDATLPQVEDVKLAVQEIVKF